MSLHAVNLHSKDDDTKMTPEELKNIEEKMKDPEFRKLMLEYMETLRDPEYRKEEEEYLKQVEKEAREGGDHSFDFVFPKPGFCIELLEVHGGSANNAQVFVNLCESDKIDEYEERTTGDRWGSNWHVPVAVGKMRNDTFNGKDVEVYDAVFHPKTLYLANRSDRFMCFLVEIAIENINGGYNKAFGFEYKRLGSPAAIGTPANQTIKRTKGGPTPFQDAGLPSSLGPIKVNPTASGGGHAAASSGPMPAAAASSHSTSESSQQQQKQKKDSQSETKSAAAAESAANTKNKNKKTTVVPKFTLLHRGEIDLQDAWNWKVVEKRVGIPKELIVKIEFPGVDKASLLDLEIKGPYIQINPSEENKHSFAGAIDLPFTVKDVPKAAKFDRSKQVLTLQLDVIPPPPPEDAQAFFAEREKEREEMGRERKTEEEEEKKMKKEREEEILRSQQKDEEEKRQRKEEEEEEEAKNKTKKAAKSVKFADPNSMMTEDNKERKEEEQPQQSAVVAPLPKEEKEQSPLSQKATTTTTSEKKEDPLKTAHTDTIGNEDRIQQLREKMEAARKEREEAEKAAELREEEERKKKQKQEEKENSPKKTDSVPSPQRSPQKKIVEQQDQASASPPSQEEFSKDHHATAEEPEVIDLRHKQKAWLEGVQQQQQQKESTAAEEDKDEKDTAEPSSNSTIRDALIKGDADDEDEETKNEREMRKKLREERKKLEAEREIERVEALMAKKMKELPLQSSYIFSID